MHSLFKRLNLLIPLVVLASACGLHAQTILTNTTLSQAVTSYTRTWNVASATGITAASAVNSSLNTYLFVDAELVNVTNVSSTQITVARGQSGTRATSHVSGAQVYIVPASLATNFTTAIPLGSCTRGNQLLLPVLSPASPTGMVVSDCLGGQWINGDATQTTRTVNYRILSPNTGAQSSASVFGTNSTTVQYTTYCTEMDLPYSKLLTGIGVHIGTTGGTDLWAVGLYDSTGNLITQSAAAGATVGTGYAYQSTAFTSKYYAVGPAQYFACVITNGTTATLDTVTTAKGDYVLAKSYTGTAFALPTTIAVPTSFASVSGPYAFVY